MTVWLTKDFLKQLIIMTEKMAMAMEQPGHRIIVLTPDSHGHYSEAIAICGMHPLIQVLSKIAIILIITAMV